MKVNSKELDTFQRRKSLKFNHILVQNNSLEMGVKTQDLETRLKSPKKKGQYNSVNLKINFGKNYLNHCYNVNRTSKHKIQNVYKISNKFSSKKVYFIFE